MSLDGRGPPPEKLNLEGLPMRYMNHGELEVIVGLVESLGSPRAMLEIGVNEGRTARVLLDNVPSLRRYVGIDVLPGYKFEKMVQRNEVPAEPGKYALKDERFELRLSATGSFAAGKEMKDDDYFDCVFIDGDHSRRAVYNDTRLALDRLISGGMIIWHDYHSLGTVDVKIVLDGLAAQGWDICHVVGTWIAYSVPKAVGAEWEGEKEGDDA